MISQAKANEILKALCGLANLSGANDIYLGLCTTEPNHETGVVSDEPTASSYARKKVADYTAAGTVFDSDFGTPSGGIIANAVEIMMSAAREEWGTINYFFLSTSSVVGSSSTSAAYLWGKVYDKSGNEGITVAAETVPVFYEGTLRASIDVALPALT